MFVGNSYQALVEKVCHKPDQIFHPFHWIGQQDTAGTDDYPAIHSLRPQFHRLGSGKWLQSIMGETKIQHYKQRSEWGSLLL
jgi:hypothetical protein